jgi:broad specificity phosphatase PhoE
VRVYVIRHADPDYANDTITRQGHIEARALSERLADYKLDTIFASPLGRAQDTARYSSERIGLPIHTEGWLTELNLRVSIGSRHDVAAWNVPGDKIRSRSGTGDSSVWTSAPEIRIPLVETAIESVANASDEFFRRLGFERNDHRYSILEPNNRQIAVFCHNGLGLTWMAHILAVPTSLMWGSFWLSPSSVSTLLFEEHSSGWATPRCLCISDTSHLSTLGIPVQTGGLTMNQY